MSDEQLSLCQTNATLSGWYGFGWIILSIAMTIVATSLSAALAFAVAFFVVGRGSFATDRLWFGMVMCALFGLPAGMLLSLVVPLFDERHHVTAAVTGTAIWAALIALFLVQIIPFISYA